MKNAFFGVCRNAVQKTKESRFRMVFFSLYLAYTLFSFVWFLRLGQARNAILSVAYFALFMVVLPIFEYFMSMDCHAIFLVILFSVPIGGILGTCYDFYMLIPFFDTLLHGISGFIFAALGYAIMERILLKWDRQGRLACLLFAVAFSLAVAVLWEMFEWLLTATMNGDMQEDSIVRDIHSYFMSGTHNKPLDILDIEKTVIIYDGGKSYIVSGGYMDLGLMDTLVDMLVCLIGSIVFLAIGAFDMIAKSNILAHFVPYCTLKKNNDDNRSIDENNR